MGINKIIQDAIKTISEQAVQVAPYDKTRGGVIKGIGSSPNTYNVQVDGVVYTNIKAVGGIVPSVSDTVTVLFPTNNTSQMIITNISSNNWIKGASDLIYPIGSYYWTSEEGFNPNDSFSGEWEKIDAGVTLVSAGTGYTVTSGTAKDGGRTDAILPTHYHSVSAQNTGNMSDNSSHSHTVGYVNYKRASTTAATTAVSYAEATANKTTSSESVEHTHSVPAHNTNSSGISDADVIANANMPPYKCAYCWHRIS